MQVVGQVPKNMEYSGGDLPENRTRFDGERRHQQERG